MALQEEFEAQGNFLFRHRGKIPVIILAAGGFAYAQYVISSRLPESTFSNGYNYCCLLVTLLGLLIRIYTVGHSSKNTSGRNTAGQVADSVNTSGIYSLIRHPLYVGNFFMWLGIALLCRNVWFIFAFVFIYWIYYERIMYAEEQFLRKKFGNAYLDWAAVTPALIPDVSRFKKPANPFDVRKVIRQEKTGVMLVFILFFLFDLMFQYLTQDDFTFRYDFWFYAMVLSVVAYAAIKLVQKSTALLN